MVKNKAVPDGVGATPFGSTLTDTDSQIKYM